MFAITLTEKGGDQRRLDFDKAEITIGRVQGNDVVLPKGNVSKRHARIVLKDGKFIIVDLKSTNGTYVNGRKITSPLVVKQSDKIYIGDFILGVEDAALGRGATAAPTAPPPMAPPVAPPMAPPAAAPAAMAPPSAPPVAPPMAPPSAPPVAPPMAPPVAAPSAPPPMAPPSAPPARSNPSVPPPLAAPQPERSQSSPPVPPPRAPRPSQAPASAPSPLPPPEPAQSNPVPTPVVGVRADGQPYPDAPPPAAPVETAAPDDEDPTIGPADGGAAPAAAQPRLVGAGAGAAPAAPKRAASEAFIGLAESAKRRLELQDEILDAVLAELAVKSMAPEQLLDEALWERGEAAIQREVEKIAAAGNLPADVDRDRLIRDSLNEALGLGPLEELLADESVSQVTVDGPTSVSAIRGGASSGIEAGFSSRASLERVAHRLFAQAASSREATGNGELRQFSLRDGTKAVVALGAAAVNGPSILLSKPGTGAPSMDSWVNAGALSPQMASFLGTCVKARRNLLVTGAPSSGRDEFLAALAGLASKSERVVSVERNSGLELGRSNWSALDASGAGCSMEELLRHALALRPERLLVAGAGGRESLELVETLSSAVDGALVSTSGEGIDAALSTIADACGLSATAEKHAIVARAFDLVIHVVADASGQSCVASIDEIGSDRPIGLFRRERSGVFVASGSAPAFYDELSARGIEVDMSVFGS